MALIVRDIGSSRRSRHRQLGRACVVSFLRVQARSALAEEHQQGSRGLPWAAFRVSSCCCSTLGTGRQLKLDTTALHITRQHEAKSLEVRAPAWWRSSASLYRRNTAIVRFANMSRSAITETKYVSSF